MWSWTLRQSAAARDRDFSESSIFLPTSSDIVIDIVLIHEITEGRDEARKSSSLSDSAAEWPLIFLQEKFPNAHVASFRYNPAGIQTLGDFFDSKRLQECTKKLLRQHPLHFHPVTASSSQKQPGHEVRGSHTTIDAPAGDHDVTEIDRPVIFVAHGFGGLIYEQALVLSGSFDHPEGRIRTHGAILLDTPHHGAGIAEWAIMCAKQLGVLCADTPQQQDWSPYQSSLKAIEEMQRRFRDIIRNQINVNIAGGYAVRLSHRSKLRLASEWAVLPDFQPITIDSDHFGMSRLDKHPTFSQIAAVLDKQIKELTGVKPHNRTVFQIPSGPSRWALLIGIDYFFRGDERPVDYTDLKSCVQDILDVERFLTAHLEVPASNIKKLILPTTAEEDMNKDEIPIFDNVVRELKSIGERAAPGDLVYIHYSGSLVQRRDFHSSRDWVSGTGLALADVMTGGAYLTDYQLWSWLEDMSAKSLHVTIVLDSSYHSEVTPDKKDGSMLPSDERADKIAHVPYRPYRFDGGSLAKPPSNCTALAARTPFVEHLAEGFLTKAMLKLMRLYPKANLPSHYRVRDEIAWHYRLRESLLMFGDGQREFFGNRRLHQGREETGRMFFCPWEMDDELPVGSAQGVAIGATYQLFSDDSIPSPSEGLAGLERVYEVRVTDVSDLRSRVAWVNPLQGHLQKLPSELQEPRWSPSASGSERLNYARLLNYALPAATLVRLSVSPVVELDATSLGASLHKHLAETPNLGLTRKDLKSRTAFNVLLDENYEFVIQDEHRKQLQRVPRVSVLDEKGLEELARVLRHLARFQSIARMKYRHGPEFSNLEAFRFRLVNENQEPLSMDSLGNYEVREGQSFFFRMLRGGDSKSLEATHITAFELTSAWGILKLSSNVYLSSDSQEFKDFRLDYHWLRGDTVEKTIRMYVYVGPTNPVWDDLALPELSAQLNRPYNSSLKTLPRRLQQTQIVPFKQKAVTSPRGNNAERWGFYQFIVRILPFGSKG